VGVVGRAGRLSGLPRPCFIAVVDLHCIGHLHAIEDTLGLLDALLGKADKTHTHNVEDVNSINAFVDNKISIYVDPLLDMKAELSHIHAIANVIGLEQALADKSNIGHTHVTADITDLSIILESSVILGGVDW
jgi:hypothetical protein